MSSSSAAVASSRRASSTRTSGSIDLLDIDKIRQLVEMMVANDLVELCVRDGTMEVQLRRPTGPAAGDAAPSVTVVAAPEGGGAAAPTAEEKAQADERSRMHEICSPMVGTFYTAPDPESPPFARVGGHVDPDTVVCIVEAMKVFNEIKAEVAGTIVKILVDNAQAVEYDQPMFLVRPD
ncbi:MAG: acetyl-CoA carboxylase biotin carboxyl carrier protein [Phycisphaerae bacterium]